MKIEIYCTAAEQMQIKRNIKTNSTDTEISFKPINKKLEDMTCGEYILSLINWRIDE